MKKNISHAALLSFLDYHPQTGVFVWLVSRGKAAKGARAGSVSVYGATAGYRFVRVDGGMYRAHRLAWFYVHKEWPIGEIDHINGDKDDNSITNLRKVTHAQNMWNARGRGAVSGLKGVSKQCKRFCARIQGDYLGTFDTAEEAHTAYAKEAMKRFGEFARAA